MKPQYSKSFRFPFLSFIYITITNFHTTVNMHKSTVPQRRRGLSTFQRVSSSIPGSSSLLVEVSLSNILSLKLLLMTHSSLCEQIPVEQIVNLCRDHQCINLCMKGWVLTCVEKCVKRLEWSTDWKGTIKMESIYGNHSIWHSSGVFVVLQCFCLVSSLDILIRSG